MQALRFFLLMELTPLALSVAAWAQSRPAGEQRTASAVAATNPASLNAPVFFARSGQKAQVRIVSPGDVVVKEVVLRAFGRTWIAPQAARPTDAGVDAEMEVPKVRVPVVFSVTPTCSPDLELAQLVAYPPDDVEWDKAVTLYSCDAPDWFNQWAVVVGLPVKRITPAEAGSIRMPPDDANSKSLLILGRTSAGKNLPDAAKLAGDSKVNVLVLDADWFGSAAGPVGISSPQMGGALADIARQRWPRPLAFASHRQPWCGIANRRAWVADQAGLPLIETVIDWRHQRGDVVLSYLPWEFQLGRDESADAVLLSVLKAAASRSEAGHRTLVEILHPQQKEIDAESRPVLQAIEVGTRTDSGRTGKLYILDLRGGKSPSGTLLEQLKIIQTLLDRPGMVYENDPPLLLILGDGKMLDEWKWLKLNRANKTIHRQGVVWMSDTELPPSKGSQIRLMLKLTELGVPLFPPGQEEKKP